MFGYTRLVQSKFKSSKNKKPNNSSNSAWEGQFLKGGLGEINPLFGQLSG